MCVRGLPEPGPYPVWPATEFLPTGQAGERNKFSNDRARQIKTNIRRVRADKTKMSFQTGGLKFNESYSVDESY